MHLISVIGVLVTLWGACAGLRGSGRNVKLTHADRAMLINYHNDLRREVHASNMQELSWDREAARAARKWGRMCNYDRPRNDGYGENIFYNNHDSSEPTSEVTMDALGVWSREKNAFDSKKSCAKTRSCEYLKMVTANVESVGCAVTTCSVLNIGRRRQARNVNFVTCFYTPYIDVTRTEPYMPGSPCTYCRTGYSCRRGLCSPPIITIPNTVIEFGEEYDKDRESRVNHIIPGNPLSNTIGTKDKATVDNHVSDSERLGEVAELRRGRIETRTYRGRGHSSNTDRLQEQRSSRVRRQATQYRSRYDRYAAERRLRQEQERRRQYEMRRKRQEEEQRRRREEERRRRNRNNDRRDGQGQGPVEQRLAAPMTEILTELGDGDVLDIVYENETKDGTDDSSTTKDSTEILIEDVTKILAEDDREEASTDEISNDIPPADLYEEEQRLLALERALYAKIAEIRKKHMAIRAQRIRKEKENVNGTGELSGNDEYYLLQMHNNIRTSGIPKLEWSKRLEKWARYVIRCDIEYPGPAFCFTNFGKVDTDRPIYNIVYDWNAEGTDLSNKLETGCRTPYDRALCNHHLVMNNRDIREMACASLDCGSQRQVTCIYQ
ncbi:uncharacterized protein [Argopecten irradians]|uniref:uncharacterized protein isoform X2 n=1 Tax=Argopecten irradians TaxID=31199 RepID=UPI0037126408